MLCHHDNNTYTINSLDSAELAEHVNANDAADEQKAENQHSGGAAVEVEGETNKEHDELNDMARSFHKNHKKKTATKRRAKE